MDEQEFRLAADRAFDELQRLLLPIAERGGFDIERHDGVVQVVFDGPRTGTFIVSRHAPSRQIWVAAGSRSYKLPWAADAASFALDGETLAALLRRLTEEHLNGG